MTEASVKRILIIEDDHDIRTSLQSVLENDGYAVQALTNGQEALNVLHSGGKKFDLILSDVLMPHVDGYTLVKKLKEMENDTPIILMTAYGTIEKAVEAIKMGAHDFLKKPIKYNDLKQTIEKALEYKRIIDEKPVEIIDDVVPQQSHFVAESPAMKKIFTLINRIARVDSTVLILGESGAGKEIVAKEIHRQSPRRDKNFIAINCAAIPADLLESELFGHTKGSFTGAVTPKKGLFEEAEGGTLLLDEIGDMTPALQAKLLRVLQEKKIRPVGGNNTKDLDVRVMAATHKDLRTAIIEGKFREDLYYRLSVIPVMIPPLRERKEDIRSLAVYFARRASKSINEGSKTFSEDALEMLQSYPWPGNVRELENVVERCLVMCPSPVITPQDLEFLGLINDEKEEIEEAPDKFPNPNLLCLKDIEKEAVILALKQTEGRKAEAAKLLGIDRKTLHRKELEYGLSVPRTMVSRENSPWPSTSGL